MAYFPVNYDFSVKYTDSHPCANPGWSRSLYWWSRSLASSGLASPGQNPGVVKTGLGLSNRETLDVSIIDNAITYTNMNLEAWSTKTNEKRISKSNFNKTTSHASWSLFAKLWLQVWVQKETSMALFRFVSSAGPSWGQHGPQAQETRGQPQASFFTFFQIVNAI